MKSPWVIPFNSAMDWNQGRQSISNDIVRRLERISEEIYDSESKTTLDLFNSKMAHSGL